MNIERNDDRILIKYVDSNFNTFKCVITTDDVFVVNFCRRDLSLLEDILKNNTLIEMDDYYVLRVEKPIFLEYQLKKEKQEEITNLGLILDKFKILEEENKMLREKVDELQIRMRNCVYLHEINECYPIQITNLTLNINKYYYYVDFDADFPKFKNLKYFTELKKIRFEISYPPHCDEDYLKINFNILNPLKKLELIEISIGPYINFTKTKLDEKIGLELENVISIKYEKKINDLYAICSITRKI